MDAHSAFFIFIFFSFIFIVDGCQQSNSGTVDDTVGIGVSRACTEEAKICPDGSAVGRVGADCEFAPCPDVIAQVGTCTCPQGYRKEEDACNPECYYNEPPCLMPSVRCERAEI